MTKIISDRFLITREVKWECGCDWAEYETFKGKNEGSSSGTCERHKVSRKGAQMEKIKEKSFPKIP